MIRTASMDLDWEMVDGPAMTYWLAELPAIPGYPDSAPDVADGGAIAEVFPGSAELGGYTFFLSIAVPDNAQCVLTNEEFHIPNADTAEEAMDEVESLSLEEISDKVAESGYAPTDVTASRKGKHMIRRSDEKTDTRIVENEDGTFTAYCEGDKKTFDDKGKAAEWLADHFNDEYHDKADARRAARRRMMMRAAARRAAMRRKAARKAADDDRKDKGFQVDYDKDGKIHVHFDDGSDMDFDDMHDFADFVEGPDADEKPVDKEEAARARHAARVAMMRRRAARVASRPVARHAMRQDDGHPYL